MLVDFKYTISCSGGSEFIKNFGIPLCQAAENALGTENMGEDGWPKAAIFGVKQGPQACTSGEAVSLGILVAGASYIGKKILDEIYTLKLQPKIKEWLQKADGIVIGGKKHKPIFTITMWYEDVGVMVMVALKGNSYSVIASDADCVKTLQQNGLDWAIQHPESGPVYLYVVENGKSDIQPKVFQNVPQAQQFLHAPVPGKP